MDDSNCWEPLPLQVPDNARTADGSYGGDPKIHPYHPDPYYYPYYYPYLSSPGAFYVRKVSRDSQKEEEEGASSSNKRFKKSGDPTGGTTTTTTTSSSSSSSTRTSTIRRRVTSSQPPSAASSSGSSSSSSSGSPPPAHTTVPSFVHRPLARPAVLRPFLGRHRPPVFLPTVAPQTTAAAATTTLPSRHRVSGVHNNNNQSTRLHRACQQSPPSLAAIQAILRQDPGAALRPASLPALPITKDRSKFVAMPTLPSPRDKNKPTTTYPRKNTRREAFRLPINIALAHHAPGPVLHLLLRAAPAATLLPDGPFQDTGTLHLALQKRPWDDDLFLTSLLAVSPAAATRTDRRHNTALHLAACHCKTSTTTTIGSSRRKTPPSLSLTVVSFLYQAFPEAVHQRNMHNETPWMIAQRSTTCPEALVSFLQDVTHGSGDDDTLEDDDDDL